MRPILATAIASAATAALCFAQSPAGSTASTRAAASTQASIRTGQAPPPRKAEDAVTPRGTLAPSRHAQFLYRRQQGPIGVLFIGDSITDWWTRNGEFSWLKLAPYQPADFGIAAERTEHVLWRIEHGELDGISPKVVVVMIGTNNIGSPTNPDTPEWAAAGVTKIVQTIHQKLPETKVLLLGVFPRDRSDSRTRADTVAINAIISKLDDGKATRYLDIGHVFLDGNGEIPADVMPDKLHPTSKGYDLWYDAMRPVLDEMMK